MTTIHPAANRRGSMMMMVVAFLGVLAAGVVIQMSTSRSANDAGVVRRLNDSKHLLYNQLSKYSAIPASLRNSVNAPGAGNAALKACVTGGACPVGVATDFTFYGPMVYPTTVAIGGPTATPIYYDSWGNPCPATMLAAHNCPLQVQTQFTATCPGTCSIQVSFNVIFSAGQNKVGLSGGNFWRGTGASQTGLGPQIPVSSVLSLSDPLP